MAVYLVYAYFVSSSPAGYTSLVVLLLVLTGFVIVSIGVVGLYVGRIFEQVKDRPLVIIQDEASARRESPVAPALRPPDLPRSLSD